MLSASDTRRYWLNNHNHSSDDSSFLVATEWRVFLDLSANFCTINELDLSLFQNSDTRTRFYISKEGEDETHGLVSKLFIIS